MLQFMESQNCVVDGRIHPTRARVCWLLLVYLATDMIDGRDFNSLGVRRPWCATRARKTLSLQAGWAFKRAPQSCPEKKKLTNVAQLQISAGPILASLSKPADKTKNPQDLKKN